MTDANIIFSIQFVVSNLWSIGARPRGFQWKYKSHLPFCMKHFMLIIKNMIVLQNFDIMSEKFNIEAVLSVFLCPWLCSYWRIRISSCRWVFNTTLIEASAYRGQQNIERQGQTSMLRVESSPTIPVFRWLRPLP